VPRPRIPRRILLPPRFLTFKPMGVPRRLLQRVTLSVDEFEAIRLADHERLDHLEAAARMGISRSTFSRLIDSAHGKVAACIIEGRELRIEGGDVDFEQSLQRCTDCGDEVLHPSTEQPSCGPMDNVCLNCGSGRVEDLTHAALYGRNYAASAHKSRHGNGRRR